MVNRYEKGKIYEIVEKKTMKRIFIGSTINTLSSRYFGHKKYNCKNPFTDLHKTIEQGGGFDNYKILLIENYPCKSKAELSKREAYWLRLEIDKLSDE